MGAAFGASDCEHCEAREVGRFISVTRMPHGHAGRAMVASPTGAQKRRTGIDAIAIVMAGNSGANVAIVTAFPVDGPTDTAGKTVPS